MQQKLRMNPPYRMAENTLSGSSELPRLIKLAESSRFRNPNDSGGSGSGWNLLWEHRSLLVFYIFAILILLALWVAKRNRPAVFRRRIVAWWAAALLAALLVTSAGLLTSCNNGVTTSEDPGGTSLVPNKGSSSITPSEELHKDWAFSMSSLTAGTATTGSSTTFPAKFSFNVNAAPDCVNDYVTFNNSLPGVSGGGGSGTPNIIALNELYSSQAGGSPAGYCGTNGPSVMWSYFSGTGSAETSVVLSELGDKVAFIETSASNGAILRILKGVAGEGTTITSPMTPTNAYVNTTVGAGGNTAWNTTNCPNGQ